MNPVLDPMIAQRVHTRKPMTMGQVFGEGKVNQAAHQVFTSDFTLVLHVRRWFTLCE